ncbi:PaaI family thioesterase [Aspergillus homomorphus CBS 101889]|uniref:Thioesterase/thiol ester dehydrase-isomerase n=1 Tax=Aspergillus homomorphus (strain CBS 101889) TaxID=1450537 RepID=A0A395HRS6_ASPHC|nr:Thioesterase/thiol ester dehydrase-isomerase [Aspergillus homomorphus CBS 101889]RAL10470.1 Thioesterase/thiol ester dehydrase-isomerase [Aspergillus homomorphus CBS 101889]
MLQLSTVRLGSTAIANSVRRPGLSLTSRLPTAATTSTVLLPRRISPTLQLARRAYSSKDSSSEPKENATNREGKTASSNLHPETTPDPPAPPPRARRSRVFRFVRLTSLAIFAFVTGLTLANQRTFETIMTTKILTDEETLDAFVPGDEFAKEVDDHIRDHPLAVMLRSNPAFTESRPHLKIPGQLRNRSLTGGTLSGPDMLVVPPLMFGEEGGKSLVSLLYLGRNLCGHPGIVHGGLLATLLDEAMGRCCFPAMPHHVGVTANLNLDYRRPAMAGNYVVLRAETVKVEGRKAWVEARIETLPENGEEPAVLVEAKALFVEPKQFKALASVYEALG